MAPHLARTVALCAGGTGGHIFPAAALADELQRRGFRVVWLTDARGQDYAIPFPADGRYVIDSASPRGRTVAGLLTFLAMTVRGGLQARRILIRERVSIVVGFGGYPSVPAVLAGRWMRCPCFLHEQNVIMGRANRFLCRWADGVALSFRESAWACAARVPVRVTGLPVRSAVAAAARVPYASPRAGSALRFLVFGGSQGAALFSEVVPAALALVRKRVAVPIRLDLQARAETHAALRGTLDDLTIEYDLAPLFDDLPARMASAHLVIARAGASTVLELAAIGRPAILVPYAKALDNDQRENARVLEAAGGCWVLPEAGLTAERLGETLLRLTADPRALACAARAARTCAVPDADRGLADFVTGEASPV